MYIGPNTTTKNLVFGYDSGYGASSNNTSTRFYKGKPTENLLALAGADTDLERSGAAPSYSYHSVNITSYVQSRWTSGNNVLVQSFEGKREYVVGGTGGGNDGYPRMYVYFSDWSWSSSFGISSYDWSHGKQILTMPNPTGKTVYMSIYHMNSQNPGRSYSRKHSVSFNTIDTPYIKGSRSSTKSLIDLKRTTDIDVSNMSFDSTGQPTFNGVDDYMSMSSIPNIPTTQITCEAVINPSRTPSTGTVRGTVIGDQSSLYLGIIDSIDGGTGHALHWALPLSNGSRVASWHGSIPKDKFTHIVGTYDGSTSRAYINGVQVWYASTSGNVGGTTYNIGIYNNRTNDGLHNFEGSIPTAKIYNLALSAQEVQQNFNAYKNRFNI